MLIAVNYHYIRPSEAYTGKGIIGVTPERFHHQLNLLAKYGQFVSGKDIADWIQLEKKHREDELYFHITFDDGLFDQFFYALPILKSLSIPATFFINTENFIEKKISDVHKIHALIAQVETSRLLGTIQKSNPTFISNRRNNF